MKRFLIAFLFLFASLAQAQTYPDHETITVNDFAGLLPAEVEAEVVAELDKLREDTGIEMTVVTLSRKDMFAPDQDLETFAAGLFDQWGIGDKTRNDGILFLVLLADREARIELGKGYAGEWQYEANSVMQNDILPEFRNEDYAAGIRAGVSRTIEKIARPFHAGAEPPKGGGVSGWWAALIALPVALFALIRVLKAKFSKCPQCGARGVKSQSRTIDPASKTREGRGETVTDCPSCGYHGVTHYTISRRSDDSGSSSSGSSFGGGSSGGGGASGKW